MALTAGTKINQFGIMTRLSAGGMGEVYLARDEQLRRKVAL
jgi:serine/threonine protein kinase